MRILFTSFAAKVHAYIHVPLAWAFRAAGHEVCFASQPDLMDDITRAGLTGVPVGRAFNPGERIKEVTGSVPDDPESWVSWEKVLDISELEQEKLTYDYTLGVVTAWTTQILQYFSPWRMIDDLVDFARAWRPDLVIWDAVTYAGPVAARVAGAAHARILFGMDLLGSMRQAELASMEELPAELRDDPLAEWLAWTVERHGSTFTEDLVTGQWTVDFLPRALRLPADRNVVPVRYTPYNGPAVVPDWLREPAKRRRVCLTRGLSHQNALIQDPASVTELLEAVADLDVEVVATYRGDQLSSVGRVPDNVRAAGFVPLNELLPTCSAIIHQAGYGTIQTALTHGVPQIVAPSNQWDSTLLADRLEAVGVGIRVHDVGGFSPEELRSALVRVLDEPSFAETASQMRTEMLGMPAPRDIVPALERLTAEGRR